MLYYAPYATSISTLLYSHECTCILNRLENPSPKPPDQAPGALRAFPQYDDDDDGGVANLVAADSALPFAPAVLVRRNPDAELMTSLPWRCDFGDASEVRDVFGFYCGMEHDMSTQTRWRYSKQAMAQYRDTGPQPDSIAEHGQ